MTETTSNRGEFVKAGYLIKSPPLSRALVSQWHRRWFLLMDSKLVFPLAERYIRLDYYQSEADAKRLADPKGSIDLSTCISVMAHNEQVKNFKFVFDVSTTDRIYHLAAESEEERLQWVRILKGLLFPPSNGHSSKDISRVPPSHVSPEVTRRMRDSPKLQRPLSYTGSLNENKSNRVQMRPLPPVPDSNNNSSSVPSSPVERRHRPLPATPITGVHVHSAPRRKPPPPIPSPYRKTNSQPLPPEISAQKVPSLSRSASLSPPCLLVVEDYQEFVSQTSSQPTSSEYDLEDNYSLATGVPPLRQAKNKGSPENLSVGNSAHTDSNDYSVLESTGYNMKDEDYSRLQPDVNDSPPPPIRQSSLAPHHSLTDTSSNRIKPKPRPRTKPHSRPRSAIPDYVNCPNESDDYSHLHH